MHINTKLRILEFIVAGVAVDFAENMFIMRATSGRYLVLEEMLLALMIIIPFAIVTEFVIDHPRFWHRLFRLKGHKFDNLDLGPK